MPAELATSVYGRITFWEFVHLASVLVRLPFVILWIGIRNFIHHRETFRRRTATNVIRWVSEKCSYQQIQYVLPCSVDVYKAWVRKRRMPVMVEELAEETRLVWVGGKRTDRVVLYVPGGAFLFPLTDCAISFWYHVQTELEKEGSSVGLAILVYSLIPTANFPMQIRQAMLAVEHIVASGVHPSDLRIVGDSAGGQLILALLSHIMHPADGLRRMVPLGGRIRCVYLMSPWVAMKSNGPSSRSRARMSSGLVSVKTMDAYADIVMAHVPPSDSNSDGSPNLLPYVDPSRGAPGWWFCPLDSVVDRVYMSAGGEEPMRDDIIAFSQTLGRVKANFVFVVQEGGVHCDPYLDFLVGGGGSADARSGPLVRSIVQWLG